MPNDTQPDLSGLPRASTQAERQQYRAPGNKPNNSKFWLFLLLGVIIIGGFLLLGNMGSAKTTNNVQPPPLPVKQDNNPLPTTPAKESPNNTATASKGNNTGKKNTSNVVEGNNNNVGNVTNVTNNITIINGSPTTTKKDEPAKPGVKVNAKPDHCDVEAEAHKVRVEGWKKEVGLTK